MLQGKKLLSTKFAIATENPMASLAALRALEKRGNAVDAAVAAGLVMGVVRPELSGLGGDFFALFYHASEDKVYCLNSSGWVSKSLSVDRVRSLGHSRMPNQGGLPVVVPGYVKGIHALHERFGKLEFSKLFDYPIDLAESGFPVSRALSNVIRDERDIMADSAKKVFMPGERLLKTGEIIRQENLARSLKSIRVDGPRAYYDGWIAQKISQAVSNEGGNLEIEDFSSFDPEWCEPITTKYRGALIHEIPPNSMGATALLALKYLGREDMGKMKPNSSERIAVTVEAAIRAYAKKDREIGDPRFAPFNLEKFLSIESNDKSASRLTPLNKADTTYYAISDEEGNILSGIQSVYFHFGSKVYVEDCGFFLNNRASAFAMDGPNKVEPRKRPVHTLSSLLVGRDGGKPEMALGASGGDFRPQQHVLFISNLLDYTMSLEDAIGYPRFLWTKDRDIMVERGFEKLDELDFVTRELDYPSRTGVAHGVEILSSGKKAVCDIRGEGIPFGDSSLGSVNGRL